MNRPSHRVLIIAGVIAVALIFWFGGGSFNLPQMHGGMTGQGWSGDRTGWLHPLLFIGAGVLIGWVIFKKK